MRRKNLGISVLLAASLFASGAILAANPPPETIYGSQLMTEQERSIYRARMWAAESDEARAAIRAEHHEQMQARAQERGLSLPEVPPARGAGMGPGPGMGSGMGQGRSR